MDRSESDWLKLKQDCEVWIRSGESRLVYLALANVPTKEIPRRWRLPLANISRRGGLILLGLRLLAPSLKMELTLEERAEYGVLLQKNGSVGEALNTLESIDPAKIPDTLLYRAFCLFTRWQYAEARPLLEAYVRAPSLAEYPRTIGKVNLASTLLSVRDYVQARELLRELISHCAQAGYSRLEGNCHEMMAQIHIQGLKWKDAERELEMASKLLSGDMSLDSFFVEKWAGIIHAIKTHDEAPLLQLRERALKLRHWESVREADMFRAKISGDHFLFQQVYFGTPHQAYRERIRLECPQFSLEETLVLGNGEREFDALKGEIDGVEFLNRGKKMHQLMLLMLSDLYRPQRLATLFGELFPDENFNVFSSPNRIHQLVRRVRKALAHERIPLTIGEEDGLYSLHIDGGIRVKLTQERSVLGTEHAHYLRLRDRYGSTEFSAKDAREKLDLPLTSFNRVLKFALKEGLLSRSGNGPKTRYKSA